MITVRINSNGLGNQMFQYAVGRSWADKTNDVLTLDCRDFNSFRLREKIGYFPWLRSGMLDQGSPRNYALSSFRVRAYPANSMDLVWRGFLNTRKLRNGFQSLFRLRGNLIREKSFGYAPLPVDPGGFNYLEGRWQSWKYFSWNRKRLISDFSLKEAPRPENARRLREIEGRNSICLHVRLGDYATSIGALNHLGVLRREYFRKAMAKLKGRISKPHYFLFSDEPQKAVQLLNLRSNLTIVDNNGKEPQEDLRLMKSCKNFIISNSTFSWWAAWLSTHSGKRVIAPLEWFSGIKENTEDLIPPEWIRI